MKASHFFLGIAAGTIAGVSAVLLSTPQSGVELRSSLKSTSLDIRNKLSDVKLQLQDLKSSISRLSKQSKEVVPQTVEDLKKSIEQWQLETAPMQQHLQAEISSIQEAIEALEKTLPKSK